MKLIEAINYINEHRLKILIFSFGILFYAGLHEFVHYFSASMTGYNPAITWSILRPRVEFLGEVPFAQFFFIAFSPYLFSLTFLCLLFMAYSQNYTNKFLAEIAVFPLLDITVNALAILVPGNDFQGIFLRAASVWQILFALLTLFALMGITLYFGQYFLRKLIDIV